MSEVPDNSYTCKWNEYVTIAVNRNLSNCEIARKKFSASTGFEPVASAFTLQCFTSWAMKTHTLTSRPIYWVHQPEKGMKHRMKYTCKGSIKLTPGSNHRPSDRKSIALTKRPPCQNAKVASHKSTAAIFYACTCGMLGKFPITVCFSDGSLGLTRGSHSHVTLHDVSNGSSGKQPWKDGHDLLVFRVQIQRHKDIMSCTVHILERSNRNHEHSSSWPKTWMS